MINPMLPIPQFAVILSPAAAGLAACLAGALVLGLSIVLLSRHTLDKG